MRQTKDYMQLMFMIQQVVKYFVTCSSSKNEIGGILRRRYRQSNDLSSGRNGVTLT